MLSRQHKVIVKVIVDCPIFHYFTELRSCTGLSFFPVCPLLFSTENIICLLNSLQAFLVQLTVKTGEVDTSRLL